MISCPDHGLLQTEGYLCNSFRCRLPGERCWVALES